MVKIIVDGLIYTCVVLMLVGFALFAMLLLRTAISPAEAKPLHSTCEESARARVADCQRGWL